MIENPPVCLVEVHRYIRPSLNPLVTTKQQKLGCGFFVKLPNSSKPYIITTASNVADCQSLYLGIDAGKGRWLRCEAKVQRLHGSIDAAILVLVDDTNDKSQTEDKREFIRIVNETALPLFSDHLPIKALQTLSTYLVTQARNNSTTHRLELQSLELMNSPFDQQPYTYMQLTSSSQPEELGSPCFIEIEQQAFILGMHVSSKDNSCFALPWLLLRVILEAENNNLSLKEICSSLIETQNLENSFARECNGLKGIEGGVLISHIYPRSRLAETQAKVGDKLLKINGKEISSTGLVYFDEFDFSFPYSLLFNSALSGSTIDLELGRSSFSNGAYRLTRYNLTVTNDRVQDEIVLHKSSPEHEFIVLSGFIFFAYSRQQYATFRSSCKGPVEGLSAELQALSIPQYEQPVILGQVPKGSEYYRNSHHWVTQVDGKDIKNLREFKEAVATNISSGKNGIAVTIVPPNIKALEKQHTRQGKVMYIKYLSPAENKAISDINKIPFHLFLMPPVPAVPSAATIAAPSAGSSAAADGVPKKADDQQLSEEKRESSQSVNRP